VDLPLRLDDAAASAHRLANVVLAMAMARNAGPHRIAREESNDHTETACTERKRNIVVSYQHSWARINHQTLSTGTHSYHPEL